MLVFALCSSFVGSLAMPSMAFANPVDGNTFTSVYMTAPKASEDTGVAFTVSAVGLLNSPAQGTQLPDTRLVINYDESKVTPGNPSTWGFVGLVHNDALSTPGKAVFDVVAPSGGFGPGASQIAVNATFSFPAGVTANGIPAAFSADIFYGEDLATATKVKETIADAVVTSQARSEVWNISYSPANGSIVDPFASNRVFTSTLTNATRSAGGFGGIYTDTIKYTQSIILPAGTTTTGGADVHFPYTAADVVLGTPTAGQIGLTAPAVGNATYVATIAEVGGIRTLSIEWTVTNVPHNTASLAFGIIVSDFVDRSTPQTYVDSTGVERTWFQPFVRSGATNNSVDRRVTHSGSVSVSNFIESTIFSSPVISSVNNVLRGTYWTAGGDTVDRTANFFDKTVVGQETHGKHAIVNGDSGSDEIDSTRRTIEYVLRGIENRDDRQLNNFFITDEGWDTSLVEFRGIKVGQWRNTTAAPPTVPNIDQRLELWYKVDGDTNWRRYGAGLLTANFNDEITAAQLIADYKLRISTTMPGTEIITGVQIRFASSAGVYNIPRQMRVHTPAVGQTNAGIAQWPVIRFAGALQDDGGELPRPSHLDPITNTVKMTYTPQATTTEQSMTSSATVRYRNDEIVNISDGKQLFAYRNNKWEPVRNTSSVAFGEILMYSVTVENDSQSRSVNNPTIVDTLDPRTKLLDPAHPAWLSMDRPRAELTVAKTGELDAQGRWITEPTRLDYDNPAHQAEINALLRFDTTGANPNFPNSVTGRPAPADRPERGFQYDIPPGPYPVIRNIEVNQYPVGPGSKLPTVGGPAETTRMEWWFMGRLGVADWELNPPAPQEPYKKNANGAITVSYLVTLIDPESPDWPTQIPKPTLSGDSYSLFVQNDFWARENLFPGGDTTEWDGEPGGATVTVAVPRLVVGLNKVANFTSRNIGQTIDYTITLTNNSNVALGEHEKQMILDPKVVDLLPVGFEYSSLVSARLKTDRLSGNTADELFPTGAVTVTNFTQPSTAAGSTDVHKGVEFSFPAGTVLHPNQSIVLTFRALIDGTGITFAETTTRSNNWNNVAAYLGKHNGNDITYSTIMPTVPNNGYASNHSNATISTNPGGATLNKYLQDNGMGAALTTVHQRVDVTLNNPVVRAYIFAQVVNGLTGPTTGNIFTNKSMVSDATRPVIRVDIENRDASSTSDSRIADSAVQVRIPNDLAFRFGPGEIDTDGNLTAAGIARITQTVIAGTAARATVDIVSGKVEEIGSPVTHKRLTLMLGPNTHIGWSAGVRLQIPAEVELNARPNMFETSIIQPYYGNNLYHTVESALIPNISKGQSHYFINDSTRFTNDARWGVDGVNRGVTHNANMMFHRSLPVPYVRTLLTGNTTGVGFAPTASALTLSNGAEFFANVTARNYGDEAIVDGKLHMLLPRGAFFIEVNDAQSFVGANSELADFGTNGFAPTLSWVGGQQLLTWNIGRLAHGYTNNTSTGAPDATIAQNGDIRITVKLGTGVAYGTNNQVTSFLATKDVVMNGDSPRIENGHLVYNYIYAEAKSQSLATTLRHRDHLSTGTANRLVGYIPSTSWPAGLSNDVSGGVPNSQALAVTNELDPLFAAVGRYDLNDDGKSHYTDYRKVGETFEPFTNNEAVVDRAVKHAVRLDINTLFDAPITKTVRAWDYDADEWGPSQHGSTAAEATRGGKVEYTIELANNTTFDFEKISIVDLFPHVGDVTIVGGVPRGSTFSVMGGEQLNLTVAHKGVGGGAVPVPLVAGTDYVAGLTVGSPPILDNWNTAAGTGIFNMSAATPTAKSTGMKIDLANSVKVKVNETLIITFELEIPGDAPISTALDRFSATNSAAMRFDFVSASTGALIGTFTGDQIATHTPSVVAVERDTAIGGFKWRDLNANGIQDAGEPGINGLIVELYQLQASGVYVKIGQTTTANFVSSVGVVDTARPGYYTFGSLADGTYRVKFSLPVDGSPAAEGYSSYAFTTRNAGSGVNDSKVHTSGTWTGYTDPITIDTSANPTDFKLNIDAGLTCEGAMIGQTVWYDANENGIKDAGEVGIGGVTVELYRVVAGTPEATPWMTRTTHTNTGGTDMTPTGYYAFGSLPIGTYVVRFVLPSEGFASENGWRFSPVTALGSTAGSGGWTEQFTIVSSTDNKMSYDAGLAYNNITIGNTVWLDRNGNGLMDDMKTVDIGGTPTSVLEGLQGVEVKLFGKNPSTSEFDVLVATTTTNASGNYTFTKLAPGEYVVAVTLPSARIADGYDNKFTTKTAGGSAVNATTGRTDAINASGSNTSYLTAHAGIALAPAISIGDTVWRDNNSNGLIEAGEPGVANVVVKLHTVEAGTDTFMKQTTTNASGKYLFDELEPGDYRVEFVMPSTPLADGYSNAWSPKTVGGSAVNPSTSKTDVIAATGKAGGVDHLAYLTANAGIMLEGDISIGDRVWLDRNGNGIQDAGEPGIQNVTVQLYSVDGTTDTLLTSTLTDATGNYLFENLIPGEYKVRVLMPTNTIVRGYTQAFTTYTYSTDNSSIYSAVDSNGWTQVIAATGAAGRTEYLFADAGIAITPNITIGDRVWQDTNGNGTQDAGEPGISGVAVNLYKVVSGVDTFVSSTTTDASGNYSFTGLAPDDYRIEVVMPSTRLVPGYLQEFTTKGGTTENNSTGSAVGANGKTDIIAATGLASDGTNDRFTYLYADAGIKIIPNISIGDTVWLDANGNGIQDAGELGIENVVVRLYRVVGGVAEATPLATTLTNASGNYLFADLHPGEYQVEVVMPSNTLVPGTTQFFTTQASGTTLNTNTGSNVNSAGRTGTINADGIAAGGGDRFAYLYADAGIATDSNISIGDTVWLDANGNGTQDAGELGIENVVVRLYKVAGGVDMFYRQTTTNASGQYLFTGLEAGNYRIAVVMPSNTLVPGYLQEFTTKGGTTLNSNNGSTVDSSTGKTDVIAATGLESDGVTNRFSYLYADAGIKIIPNISIGDRVWLDRNGNGIQDAVDEPGLQNVVVRLYRVVGGVAEAAPLATTTTNASGNYLFEDLHPGEYQVEVAMPSNTLVAGYTQRFTTKGGTTANNSTGSAVNVATGRTDTINANGLEADGTTDRFSYLYADAGIAIDPNISIGDLVWLDTNGNGIKDATESGIENVVVRLYKVTGGVADTTPLASTTTNASGNYLFSNLHPGDYQVEVVMPSIRLVPGYLQEFTTKGGTTANSNTGSAVNVATGRTDTINATGLDGAVDRFSYLYADAGIKIIPNISIGDFIWLDKNGNGIQDLDEPGIADVVVRLYTVSGGVDTFLAQTTTNASGGYLFSDLHPGNYRVEVVMPAETLVPGTIQRFTLKGATLANNSTGSAVDNVGKTDVIAATGLEADGVTDRFSYLYADAGIAYDSNISIGDRVWLDRNGNGIQDAVDEPGIQGVVVNLYKVAGGVDVFEATTTTDAAGAYLFENLEAGNYRVEVVMPTNTLVPGYTQRFTTKTATTLNSNTGSAVGANGKTDVIAATGYEADGVTDRFDYLFADAGIAIDPNISIGDRVWLDRNGNGIQDAIDEPGIENVVVRLYKVTGGVAEATPLASTTTNASGNYLFSNLHPGEYQVEVVMPTNTLVAGYTQRFTTKGGTTANSSTGSAVNVATGRTDTINANGLETDGTTDRFSYLYADAGIAIDPNISIGDLVWLDTNGNGTKDATESGIENVVVRLYRVVGGVADTTPLASTTTNASGNYLFSNLHPGDYQVEVVMPSNTLAPGYTQRFTTKTATTLNTNTGSAVNTTTGRTDTINATGLDGAADRFAYLYADAGIAIDPNISIGDRVWVDRNGNGLQDDMIDNGSGGTKLEGVAGVTVKLYKVVGGAAEAAPLATTTTDADGNYLFEDLHPGDYKVKVDMPTWTVVPGYLQRFTTQGSSTSNSSLESAVDADGWTNTINATGLDATSNDRFDYLFADAGIAIDPNVSIGDFVWLDFDGDGLANDMIDDGAGGEKLWGVANVTVDLYKHDDATDDFEYFSTTITDADGNYEFTELHPGDYKVRVIMPSYTLVDGYTQRFTTKGLSKANNSLESAVDADGWTDTIEATGLDGLADRFAYKFNHAGIAVDGAIKIGDIVWLDRNGNGLMDDFIIDPVTGEEKLEGVPSVRVELYGPTLTRSFSAFGEFDTFNGFGEQLLATTFTDADGNYGFGNLIPGEYRVRVVMPEYRLFDGYNQRFTTKNASSVDGLRSLVDEDGWTDWFTVTGELDVIHYRLADAGIALDGALSIGDQVWLDRNANGVQDDMVNGKLEGIANVKVELFEGNFDTAIATTTTDADGKYLFGNLEPGTYRVKVTMPDKTLVEGHTQAFSSKGNTTENDNTGSAVNAEGWTGDIVITGANERLEYLYADAGIALTKVPVTDPPTKPNLGGAATPAPKTGDDVQGLFLSMLALTVAAAVVIVAGAKNRRKEEKAHL